MAKRAGELQQALDAHGRERTALVTLTLRHHAGIPLRVLRVLLARSWSELFGGRVGGALKRTLGVVGYVRGAEQTFGANGWHPHLHCLLFLEREPPASWVDLLTARWLTVVELVVARMAAVCAEAMTESETEELRAKVQRVLGASVASGVGTLAERATAFRAELERMGGVLGVLPLPGVAVVGELCTTGAASRYLAKLGCELSGVGKQAADGHYTTWQLARAAAAGEQWAQARWREHSAAMRGARQLTWSRGLRALLGLEPERSDEELAAELTPEPGDVDTPLATIEGPVWDLFARQRRQLWLAELHQAFAAGTLDQTLWGPDRDVRQDPSPAPVWWRSIGARANGRRRWRVITNVRNDRDEYRGRYVSADERRELREELAHHLACDHGLGLHLRPQKVPVNLGSDSGVGCAPSARSSARHSSFDNWAVAPSGIDAKNDASSSCSS